jgi:hypothetical protein
MLVPEFLVYWYLEGLSWFTIHFGFFLPMGVC